MQDRPAKTAAGLFTPIEVGPLKLPQPHRHGALDAEPRRRKATCRPRSTRSTTPSARAQGSSSRRRRRSRRKARAISRRPASTAPSRSKGWQCVTGAVHVAGGRMVLQLWHVGRISHPSFQPGGKLPVAPSAIKPNVQAYTANGFEPIPTPRALETDEIPGIVQQYAQGARNATRRRASTASRCMARTAI